MILQEFKARFNIHELKPQAITFFETIPQITANDQNTYLYQAQLRDWLKRFSLYMNRVTQSRTSLTNGLHLLTVCQEAFQAAIQIPGVLPVEFDKDTFELVSDKINRYIAEFDRKGPLIVHLGRAKPPLPSTATAATSSTSTTIPAQTVLRSFASTSISNAPAITTLQIRNAVGSNWGMHSLFQMSGGNQASYRELDPKFVLILIKDSYSVQANAIKRLCYSRLKFINQLIDANKDSWDTIVAFLSMIPAAARIQLLTDFPDNSVDIQARLAGTDLYTAFDHCPEATDGNKLVIYAARLLSQVLGQNGYFESCANYSINISGTPTSLNRCALVEEVIVRHMSFEGLHKNVNRISQLANDSHLWVEAPQTVLEYKRSLMRNLSARLRDFDAFLQEKAKRTQDSAASTSQGSSATAATSLASTSQPQNADTPRHEAPGPNVQVLLPSANDLLKTIPHLTIPNTPHARQDFLNQVQQYQTDLAFWLHDFNFHLNAIITNEQALNSFMTVLKECYRQFLVANGHHNFERTGDISWSLEMDNSILLSDKGAESECYGQFLEHHHFEQLGDTSWSLEMENFILLSNKITEAMMQLNPELQVPSIIATVSNEPTATTQNPPRPRGNGARFSIFNENWTNRTPHPLLELRYLKVLTQGADFSQTFDIHNLCNQRLTLIHRVMGTNKNSWETILAFLNRVSPDARIRFLKGLPDDTEKLPPTPDGFTIDYSNCPTLTEDYTLIIAVARLLTQILNKYEYYESCARYSVRFEGEEDINLNRCALVEEVVVRHMSLPGVRANLKRLEQLDQNAPKWRESAGTVLDCKPAFMKNISRKLNEFAYLAQEEKKLRAQQQSQQAASTTTLVRATEAGVKRSAPSSGATSASGDAKRQHPGM